MEELYVLELLSRAQQDLRKMVDNGAPGTDDEARSIRLIHAYVDGALRRLVFYKKAMEPLVREMFEPAEPATEGGDG